jgi:hypothetical protein
MFAKFLSSVCAGIDSLPVLTTNQQHSRVGVEGPSSSFALAVLDDWEEKDETVIFLT